MTQIVVTLDNNADESFIRRFIENIKGVVKTSLETNTEQTEEEKEEVSEWIRNLRKMRNRIDPSVIDMNDERTRYILSK